MLRCRRIIATLVFIAAGAAHAQELEPGQLLVANPNLSDPNFSETVLLLVHHAADGSLAVALNRPTWVDAAEAFPEVPSLEGFDESLFFGGPMAPNQLLIVFESDGPAPENSRPLVEQVYLTVDVAILDNLDPAIGALPRIRFFAGHAAWNPGQLEAEIAAGNWHVQPGSGARIFDADSSDLWDRLPRRTDEVTAGLR